MTDTFIQGGQPNDPATQSQGSVDQTNQQGDGSPDTHSPEHQISVMQKRIQDKDEFIKQLQEEAQSVREQYALLSERAKNMDEITEVLKGAQQQDVGSQDTSLDEDALVGKVIENLNKQQLEERRNQNYNSVLKRLEGEFGAAHVETKVQEAAKASGLTVQDMVETAKKSPQAFYRLVGLQEQRNNVSPSPARSSMQAPSDNSGQRDYAYYARLMRENPKEYWKPETQREFRKLFTQQGN